MPRKRRRAIPSDFDPVYPYDRQSFVISAPFVNTDKGLTTDPPGFIALKVQYPLAFDNDGNLIITGGGGVLVDVSKGLEKVGETIAAKVAAPIQFDNAGNITIGIDEARGLDLEGGQIGLKIDPAFLQFSQGMLSLIPGIIPTLSVDSNRGITTLNGAIAAKVETPVTFSNNGYITLEYGDGLDVENFKLVPKVKAPLTLDSQGIGLADGVGGGSIEVDSTKGLQKTGDLISVKVTAPLNFDADGNVGVDYDQTG